MHIVVITYYEEYYSTRVASLMLSQRYNQCFSVCRPQILILLKLNDDLMPKYRKMLTFSSQLKAGRSSDDMPSDDMPSDDMPSGALN